MGLCLAVFETASCACCLGKCLCAECLCTDGKLSTTCANGVYLLVLVLMTLIAFVLQTYGAPEFNFYSFNVGCGDIPGIDVTACKGENAVYRISIGLSVWFVVMALANLCSHRFHTGLWGIKLVSLVALVTGFFFIPIAGQYGYVEIARVISAVFLVSQIVAFIDAAYHWNAYFVDKAFGDQEDRRWTSAILAICFAIVAAIVVSIALMYIQYSYCTRQSVFITVTLVLILASTLLQLNSHDTDSSLLTSCIVGAYSVYLGWSAVSSDECNPGVRTDEQLALACFVSACSLAWTCYSAGMREWTSDDSAGNALLHDPEDDEEEEPEEEPEPEEPSMIWFHMVMATGSVYMSMLLTNWGTVSGHKSAAQMWVSIVSQWVSMLLYVWTLVAPRFCPNREF